MSEQSEIITVEQYSEQSYLEYAMYVILDRALPKVSDGLKPVQRRILYAMHQLGLPYTSKPKKSARTIGDVLGKYHPHGDSACYEAMVLMAQEFHFLHPYITGQGNWGSIDNPKSFAAMRYTEAKLSQYAKVLLDDLDPNIVAMVPNYDGTSVEPRNLAAQLPNILINGGSGIAVGMATDIPSHNISDLIACLELLLTNPDTSDIELVKTLKGPDLACGGQIVSSEQELISAYSTGVGSLRVRGTYRIEGPDLVIDSTPQGVSICKLMEQIAELINNKKLPMVEDLRDESEQEDLVRIVLKVKSKKFDLDQIMLHIFANTDLETNIKVNMNAIDHSGNPKTFNLKSMLLEWLDFRVGYIKKKYEYRVARIQERLHILDGFLLVFANIDEIIRIIRFSEKPHAELMTSFKLSELQATAILELKLKHIAKLEELKIQTERDELIKEQEILSKLLNSKTKFKNAFLKELRDLGKTYFQPRKTIIKFASKALSLDLDKKVKEELTTVLSAKNWIRTGKGHELDGKKLNYKAGDKFYIQCLGNSLQPLLIVSSKGKIYNLESSSLPSVRSSGEPLTKYIDLLPDHNVVQMLFLEEKNYLLVNSDYEAFVVSSKNLQTKQKGGKQILTSDKHIIFFTSIGEHSTLVIHNKDKIAAVSCSDFPNMSKGKGVKIAKINTPLNNKLLVTEQEKITLSSKKFPISKILIKRGAAMKTKKSI